MPFYLSPSVNIIETDLTTIIPAVSTSVGAAVGAFPWGPVMEPLTVGSETDLIKVFGKPNDNNFMSFFPAANFLAYSNNLLVVRADSAGLKNAVCSGTAIKIKNLADYEMNYDNGAATVGPFAAKYPGKIGNSLKVSIADEDTFATWDYADEFDGNPGTSEYAAGVNGEKDGLHIIVIDEDGLWTGTRGAILEKFSYLSKASDAIRFDGTTNYYKNVINNSSKYIWWMDHPVTGTTPANNWGQDAAGITFESLTDGLVTVDDFSLVGGEDDYAITDGNKMNAFSLFENADMYDISLIIAGKASAVVAEHILVNIAEVRKDCVVFISPEDITSGGIIIGDDDDTAVNKVIAYRNELPSSSYGFLDSGYKYQYDRYNDKYRWVPLNGDIAGLAARTDYTHDTWWSFAGHNRGIIKNVVKLSLNVSRKAYKDKLSKSNVNAVLNIRGEGPTLFNDKTLLSKPSAFDAINVRRLFITLEKAIATAAKYSLFEFNDPFTRAQFKNMVEPFLRAVQGRRGLQDFRVKCDETNNDGNVIDSNLFVASIYLKPARAIRYIELNFIATRTDVSFEEIGA